MVIFESKQTCMPTENLVLKAKTYVQNLLDKSLSQQFIYHNFNHAQNVVNAIKTICFEEGVDNDELNTLLIAAWFHDTGFIHSIENHEAESIKIVQAFLLENNVDKELIHQISQLILATKMPQTPKNNLEKILCDADLFHLGTDNFKSKSEILRKEWELTKVITFSEEEWLKNNVLFLKSHNFFTQYAIDNLTWKKQQNLLDAQRDLKQYLEKKQKNKC